MNITPEEAKTIKDALDAAGVFDTPVARMRLKGHWDDYHVDAAKRRKDALATIIAVMERQS